MSPDNVQALPPGTRLGDYRLDAMIGHGGFGITYRAFDTQLAKIVAIKEYLPLECAIRQADGEVVPGVGGSVYELLGIGTAETKNAYSPELVRRRRALLTAGGAAS